MIYLQKRSSSAANAAKHRIYFDSPIGRFRAEDDGKALTCLGLDNGSEKEFELESELLLKTKAELGEYFDGRRKEFDLPLNLSGTDFELKVWNALLKIPYGEICSYADIAAEIGKPKACRAVGGANSKNPIMLIVPCHRVIGKNGAYVGYSAGENAKAGIWIKEFLLKLEQSRLAL